jgi:hypothetical protein
MKLGLNIFGILLALMGLVWFLQGIGVLQGSVMSNQTQWVIIGLALGYWSTIIAAAKALKTA